MVAIIQEVLIGFAIRRMDDMLSTPLDEFIESYEPSQGFTVPISLCIMALQTRLTT